MQTFTIGRDASNDIILNDKMVSRKHAQLQITGDGRVLIKDSGSSNGTFVNGNKITEFYLKPGDVVKCAGVFLNWQHCINLTASNQNEPQVQKNGVSENDNVGGQSMPYQNQSQIQKPQMVIVKGEKSMGVTILLTFLFGPLGMLYSTITGGIVMFFLGGLILLITLGFAIFIIWPICIIWAAVATSNYNKNLGALSR
jgi:hypothetical protein